MKEDLFLLKMVVNLERVNSFLEKDKARQRLKEISYEELNELHFMIKKSIVFSYCFNVTGSCIEYFI